MASEYSDPYEDWKAQGKPGGSYSEWQGSQQPAAAPAAPETSSAPKTPAPSTTSNPYTENPYAPKGKQGGYQNYDNYTPPQQGYQTYQNPTGAAPANNAAQNYFNQFSAADQDMIRKSWGGADRMQEWYNNAKGAGATNQAGAMAPNTGVGKDAKTGLQTIQADPSKDMHSQGIASYNGEVGFSQQNMPDRTGMRAWAKANGMSEDFDRFDENQLLRWQNSLDPACPPKTPFRADDGSGCVEKPIDSNKPGGVGGGGGGAGGGGGQGGGGGYGGGAGYGGGVGQGGISPDDLALYQVKRQYSEALADPTGQKAWELYSGQGGEKAFQAEIDRNRKAIAGMPEGPARDAAIQRLNEQEMSMRMELPKDARAASIQGLTGVIQPELGYVASERDRQLQHLLGTGNLSNQRYGMNLNYNLGSRAADLAQQGQAWNQNTLFPWETGQAAAALANSRYPYDQQQQQQQSGGLGSLFGELAGQGLSYAMSDIRVKEDIQPGRRGLSDLLKLRSYSYNYKGRPEKTQSIMAQDLERVAPEFVKEFDGVKHVDSYGLLGMTMKAVQDLAKKMEKK